MFPLLRTTCCLLAASAHRLAGRIWFKAGSHERARDHFERVLELKGDDFVAYVFLGRLAYNAGDYAGWRREYEHARRTAPDRYARLKNPFDLFEPRSAGTIREETGERATWRTVKVHNSWSHHDAGSAQGGFLGGDGLRFLPRSARMCPDGDPARRCGDDFASEAERKHFRMLPPIDAHDVADTDLDRLIDDLTR